MIKKLMFFLLVAIVSAGVMTSCSDDDDDDPISTGGNSEAGMLRGTDGQQLWISSFGSNDVEYDEKGRIVSVGDYEFYYDPFTITSTSYGDTVRITDIRLNGSGFITSMNIRSKSRTDSYEGSASFSYDASGHITHLVYSLTERDWYDGEVETSHWKAEGTFAWNNNRLITYTEDETDLDEGDVDRDVFTFDYGENEYPNRTHQWTPEELHGETPEFDFLFCLGYLGVAGDYFPVSSDLHATTNYDDEDSHSSTSYTYSFNDDGSVRRAGGYSFTYLTR